MTLQPLDGNPSLGPTPAEAPPSSSTNPILKPIQDLLAFKKKQEWAQWVDSEFEKCKSARAPYEQQWYLNIAFTNGRQYVNPIDVPNAGFRLTTPKAPPWRVRLVVNKIRTAVRTESAKLTSGRIVPTVVPQSTEDEDFTAARVSEQILKSAFQHRKFRKEFRSYVWWGVTCGNSFLKSYWDPTKIDPLSQLPPQPIMNAGQPIKGPDGQPIMAPSPVVRGEICVERVTPFHIYVPDVLSEGLEDQPYVIHAMTRTKEWVFNSFGVKATPDARSTNSILESAVLGPRGSSSQFDCVLVKEIWIKPGHHPDFPEGGMLTVINTKVVQHQTKWPWPFQEFPFYKYDGIPTGSFYCDSVVVDLIPLQKEYNRTKSQSIEIKNTIGRPKVVYAKGSLNPRQITSEPGQSIQYTAGFPPPQIVAGAEVPRTMGEELDRLTSDFDDISGQHEITRGNTPSQVTSGTAIAFLQEQDDTKLSYQVDSIEDCIEALGTHYLKYASRYWSDERAIRVAGAENTYEVKRWKGSDLRGNCDVQVQTGSGLPQSKAAKQALIMEMMTNGFIPPESGLEILDMGGFEKLMEEYFIDKRQAQRENMKLAEVDPAILKTLLSPPVGPDGQPVMGPDGKTPMHEDGTPFQPQPPMPANSWDNHEVHIQIHNQFRKTQQFELLPQEVKQAFELHVQAHQMALVIPQMGAAGILNPDVGQQEEELPPEEGGEDNFAGEGEEGDSTME